MLISNLFLLLLFILLVLVWIKKIFTHSLKARVRIFIIRHFFLRKNNGGEIMRVELKLKLN